MTPASRKAIAALGPPPRLGLNAVGGPSATNLSRLLGHSGTLVTYGGMSREPLKLATSSLIFSNLQAKGFWLSAWNGSASLDERVQMITEILGWMSQKEFKSPELSTTPLKDMDWSNWDWTAPKTLLVSPPA